MDSRLGYSAAKPKEASMEALTHYGMIAFLVLAIVLDLMREWTKYKDRKANEPDEHEDNAI